MPPPQSPTVGRREQRGSVTHTRLQDGHGRKKEGSWVQGIPGQPPPPTRSPPTHIRRPHLVEPAHTPWKVTTAVMARLCAGLLVLVLSTLTTATPPTPRSPLAEATDATRCGGKMEAVNETLSELMEDYFKWKLHTYPEWATMEVGFETKIVICKFSDSYVKLILSGFPWLQPPGRGLQHGGNPRKGREVPRVP